MTGEEQKRIEVLLFRELNRFGDWLRSPDYPHRAETESIHPTIARIIDELKGGG